MIQKSFKRIKADDDRLVFFALVFSLLLTLPSCDRKGQWEKEFTGLLEQTVGLKHRHCQLNASIDSLWDTTSAQLKSALPASFPATDRDIFFKARNADHIRMFMSFKLLDSSTQALVDEAGKYDAALAAQIRDLSEKTQLFEQQKIQFLKQVEQQNPEASRGYAAIFRTAVTDICQ